MNQLDLLIISVENKWERFQFTGYPSLSTHPIQPALVRLATLCQDTHTSHLRLRWRSQSITKIASLHSLHYTISFCLSTTCHHSNTVSSKTHGSTLSNTLLTVQSVQSVTTSYYYVFSFFILYCLRYRSSLFNQTTSLGITGISCLIPSLLHLFDTSGGTCAPAYVDTRLQTILSFFYGI